LSKADLLDKDMKKFLLAEFTKKYKKKKIFLLSSATSEGLLELKDFLVDSYTSFEEPKKEDAEETKVVIYDLKNQEDDEPRNYKISDEGNLVFHIQ
jgi:hypothetical protein